MFVFEFLIICVGSGGFSVFIEECLEDGMILNFWKRFIDKYGTELTGQYHEGEEVVRLKWWYKPLGGCVVCYNFWITNWIVLTWAYLTLNLHLWFIPFLIIGNGISYICVIKVR